jgi:hypothetical protein
MLLRNIASGLIIKFGNRIDLFRRSVRFGSSRAFYIRGPFD